MIFGHRKTGSFITSVEFRPLFFSKGLIGAPNDLIGVSPDIFGLAFLGYLDLDVELLGVLIEKNVKKNRTKIQSRY